MNFKRIPSPEQIITIALAILVTISLTACGGAKSDSIPSALPSGLTAIGSEDANGVVVKSRAVFTLYSDSGSLAKTIYNNLMPSAYALTGTQGVTVVNSANASMTLNTTAFLVPAISNTLLDFGSISITALTDNSLSVCGTGGKTKCNKAVIQMYTTGQAGAGLWNSVEGYGIPMTAQLDSSATVQTLNTETSKVTVQSENIPTTTKVWRQSNFANALKYKVKSDFTEAGSGSFTTTVVVEYGLTL